MKKLLSILLICTMMFCLAACGKEEITEDDFIGNWSGSYEYTSSIDNSTDVITLTVEIYKGGAGKVRYYSQNRNEEYINIPAEWELAADNEVLKVTTTDMFGDTIIGFDYDKENKTLTRQDYREAVLTKE